MGHDSARFSARYWPVPLVRAAVAAVAALVVTFSPDHSPAIGLAVFGSLALIGGAVVAATARRADRTRSATVLTIAQGAVSAALGVAALLSLALGASLGALVALVLIWAVATAAPEMIVGLRRADASAASRDHVAVAGAALLLGIVVLLARDDAVFVVGAIGAYSAVVAVYLAIAAFSLKWETTHAASPRSAVES